VDGPSPEAGALLQRKSYADENDDFPG
jgi:hypothetical protein